MTHYRMLDRAPSVVITSNRNELKVYQDNVVYLNNGENFELRFFNPLQEKVGVEIIFNGTRKGDGFLVLNPGQDIILDRFLDEQRKMLFETYVINGNNQAAVEAAEQNGLITFNFYKERYSYNHKQDDVNVVYDFPPKPPKPYKYKKSWNTNTYTTTIPSYYYSAGVSGSQGPQGPVGASGGEGTIGHSFTRSISIEQDYWFPTSSNSTVTLDNLDNSTLTSSLYSMDFQELETGRIEKGEISDQTLKTVNAQFASNSFHTISYKMLPYSAMNKTSNEIRQYCTECGYRVRKSTWKYCPKCGERL